MTRTVFATLAFCMISLCPVQAQTSGWRGDGTGQFPGATPPLTWSTTENIRWKTPLSSWSNGSPALGGNRLFLTSEPATLLCLDADTGAILWQQSCAGEETLTPEERALWDKTTSQRQALEQAEREIRKLDGQLKKDPQNAELTEKSAALKKQIEGLKSELKDVPRVPRAGGHGETGGTTSTPCVDVPAKRVYAFFGSGVTACFDFDGKRQWIRALPLGSSGWGHTASPLLVDGQLVILPGDLVALDPATGKTLWQIKSAARHGSPIRLRVAATTDLIVTPSGQAVTPAGKELVTGMFSLPFNAPVVSGTSIFACGMDETKAQAWQVQVSEDGTASKKMLWEAPIKKGRYFSSPVVIGDIAYAMRQSGQLTAIQFGTGAVLVEKTFDLGSTQFYPSLAAADGRLYAFSDNGTTVVIEPGAELKELARNKLEKIRSCPLFHGKRIYLRCWGNAYCIEEMPPNNK